MENRSRSAGIDKHSTKSEKWQLVSALGTTQIISWGTTFYMPAVFASRIADESSWSLSGVTGGLSLALLLAGVTAPTVGRFIDRNGGKHVMSTGTVMVALGLALLGASTHFALYLIAWTIIGIGMAGTLYDAAFATLGKRFGAQARAPITGITLFGGLASTICWPFLTLLADTFGWRHGCFVIAAVHLIVCLPLHYFVLPTRLPQENIEDCKPLNLKTPRTHPNWRSFLREKSFWWICIAFTGLAFVMTTFGVHMLKVLSDLGLSPAEALLVGTFFGPAQVLARIVELRFCQKVHPLWMALAGSALVFGGVLGFAPGDVIIATIAAMAYGMGNGIITIARGTLPLAAFGTSNLGERMGCIAVPALIAQSVAPMATGRLLETSSGETILYLCAGLLLLSSAALIALRFCTPTVRNNQISAVCGWAFPIRSSTKSHRN